MTTSSIQNIAGATGLHAPEPSSKNTSLRAFEALISDAGVDIAFQEAKEGAASAVRAINNSSLETVDPTNNVEKVVSSDSATATVTTTGTKPVHGHQSANLSGLYSSTGKAPFVAQAMPDGQFFDVTG